MIPILQIAKFALDGAEWAALASRQKGLCTQIWLQFDGDMRLRSDPSDATTEFLAQLVNGNRFEIPCPSPVSVETGRVFVYAQAVSGVVNVTLFSVMFC